MCIRDRFGVEGLSEAVYIQYELDRGPRREVSGRPPSWSIHSVFASLVEPGVIWVPGNGSNSIIKVDTRERDFAARTTEYWIENAENIKDTLETMGKPAPVHDGSKPITLPPQTKFEGDLEEDAQEFSLPPAI